MMKTLLLGAAAALVLTAGGVSAAPHAPSLVVKNAPGHVHLFPGKGAKTLYDQTDGDTGVGVVSDAFDSGTFASYDDQGADDFSVPKGQTWTVTEVDVPGVYFNGPGPSDGENVTFYSDSSGTPGTAVKKGTFTGVMGGDSAGTFTIKLGKKGVKLKGGKTYWVSVQTNMNFGGGAGEWGWESSGTQHGNAGMWQNPGNGFATGCTTWAPVLTCLGYGPDFLFALKGKSK